MCFPSKKVYGNIQYHFIPEKESPSFQWQGMGILEELQGAWIGAWITRGSRNESGGPQRVPVMGQGGLMSYAKQHGFYAFYMPLLFLKSISIIALTLDYNDHLLTFPIIV